VTFRQGHGQGQKGQTGSLTSKEVLRLDKCLFLFVCLFVYCSSQLLLSSSSVNFSFALPFRSPMATC
jgi:hypothetical protein